MDLLIDDFIKQREIHFRNVDPAANDAQETMLLLVEIVGIENIQAITPSCVHISYDLRHITLQVIETALIEVGFHLDNNLLAKMKRALFYYTEETQLMNQSYLHDQASSTLDVFVSCYNLRVHGCRDERPEYLRHYP